jgi:hypothetical protein
MAFSAILLAAFAVLTVRNLGDVLDAESAPAALIDEPILSPAGETQIATARVSFTTEAGRSVEAFVIGVPIDASIGDTVTVHYLGSDPEDATVDDPPNRMLKLVLSAIFTAIGAGGLWSFGQERPRPEYDD